MKISLVIYSMAGGGAERITAMLAHAWIIRGHDVGLITLSQRQVEFYELNSAVRRTRLSLDWISRNSVSGLINNWRRVWALRNAIQKERPQLVVSMMDTTNVLSLLATRWLGIPVIVSERTHPPMYPLGRFWETLRRLTYPWAHRVVLLTADTLGWLTQSIPSAAGVVIPNPVVRPLPSSPPLLDVAQFTQPNRPFVLAAGRMDAGKQFDRLITAFHGLHEEFPGWDLVILGDGPARPTLESQVRHLSLTQRVLMPGRAGNIGDWYSQASLYVLSSRFEGFPNVLIEAMAHGCPVVSYDCDTGPRDIIRHGLDGLLVRPVGDIPALQAAMKVLMSSSRARHEQAASARLALERFSLPRVMELWDQVLDSAPLKARSVN